jgi:prepilin-type N-terminal cleavage/methylation domain-containing protein
MRRRNWQAGFSLIELLLAAAMTAAALGAASWAFGLAR